MVDISSYLPLLLGGEVKTIIKYKNLGGNSGVDKYEIGEDYIKVVFKDSHETYKYSTIKPGKRELDKLISLAQRGRGLNSYISTHIKKRYEKKY